MSDDCYGWSCPMKNITKCNVSPRLIESQFTVYNRQSYAIKRTESPIYHLTTKSNNFAKLVSKRDQATSWKLPVPKQEDSKQDLDKNTLTTQKSIEIKNLKTVTTRNFRSYSPKTSKCRKRKLSRCANRSIQTERQGVFSHFTSMVDGIGIAVVDNAAPWIPCVGATALAIVLFGYFSKKVEQALSIYNTANELLSMFPLNDIPLMGEERDVVEESPIPEPGWRVNGVTVDPHTLKFHYNKLGRDVEENPIPKPSRTNGATVDTHRLVRFHYNKLKWPLEPLTLRKSF